MPRAKSNFLYSSSQQASRLFSPRAKNLAEKAFADISLATPTGPNGRIIERDVERLISEGKVVTPAASEALGKGIAGTGLGGRVTTADIAAAAASGFRRENPASYRSVKGDRRQSPVDHRSKA